jgi:hypothetical protein
VLRVRYLPEPVPDRHFWPARQEHPQPDAFYRRPHLSQQLHDGTDVVFIVALVERINDYDVCFWPCFWLVQLRQRTADEVLPLVAQ